MPYSSSKSSRDAMHTLAGQPGWQPTLCGLPSDKCADLNLLDYLVSSGSSVSTVSLNRCLFLFHRKSETSGPDNMYKNAAENNTVGGSIDKNTNSNITTNTVTNGTFLRISRSLKL